MNYLLSRLKEPSTWRGLVILATSCGLTLSPEQSDAILAVGLLCAGLIGVFTPDKGKEDA
jgi:hypothetical protein